MSTQTPERRYTPDTVVAVRSDGEPSRLEGYAAIYYDGTERTQYRLWDDAVERIMPGAFTRAVVGDDIRGLFNHDPNLVLGRTKAKTMTVADDQTGLKYEITPPDTEAGRSVMESVARGDVTGSSFSFLATDVDWRREDGVDIREIRGVRLFDVGPVTFPAYEATTAGVRTSGDCATAMHELNSKRTAAEVVRQRIAEAKAKRMRIVDLTERDS